ncbi:hypothetical protein D3C81_1928460 [compost metagenome]
MTMHVALRVGSFPHERHEEALIPDDTRSASRDRANQRQADLIELTPGQDQAKMIADHFSTSRWIELQVPDFTAIRNARRTLYHFSFPTGGMSSQPGASASLGV